MTTTINNKKLGNDFESRFCKILFENGYWVHNFAQNAYGQPADIIAVRGKKAYLIDCKVCSNKGFSLSRIEANQYLSMEIWESCGNGDGWFSINIGDDVTMISHSALKTLRNSKSYINKSNLKEYGIPLERWLQNT